VACRAASTGLIHFLSVLIRATNVENLCVLRKFSRAKFSALLNTNPTRTCDSILRVLCVSAFRNWISFAHGAETLFRNAETQRTRRVTDWELSLLPRIGYGCGSAAPGLSVVPFFCSKFLAESSAQDNVFNRRDGHLEKPPGAHCAQSAPTGSLGNVGRPVRRRFGLGRGRAYLAFEKIGLSVHSSSYPSHEKPRTPGDP